MSKHRFSICFIIIYLQCVLSLRVYKSNSAHQDLLPPIENALYRKNSVYFKEKPDYRRSLNYNDISKTFLGKSVLVSRIIPHGYSGGQYEYDSKFNTLYKPLIRFHVKKPLKKVPKDAKQSSELLGYAVIINKHGRQNGNKNRYDTKSMGLEESNLIRLLRKGTHTAVLGSLMDKSGEEIDTLAPGHVPIDTSSEEVSTKPSLVLPVYPFWNYWTYSKNIHQDDCPGSLVRLGDVCIAASGHRKNNKR